MKGLPQANAWLGVLAIDTAAVLVFATAGRQSHEDGSGLSLILTIAAPFLIGLVAGTALIAATRRDPLALTSGAVIWVTTVVLGLLLRRLAWDRGTALSFVIVTTLVLGALLLGWRALWIASNRRRTIRS